MDESSLNTWADNFFEAWDLNGSIGGWELYDGVHYLYGWAGLELPNRDEIFSFDFLN